MENMETITTMILQSCIILWNSHYNLNFNVGQQEMKMTIMHRLSFSEELRKKKGHKWPKLKIISASKAENKKKMAQN